MTDSYRSASTPVADPILDDLRLYLGASPTPFHAVAEARARLLAHGLTELHGHDSWHDIAPGGYFTSLAGANLVAFVVPPAAKGFRIVGAHTDSPNLRLKPNAEYTQEGYTQLGVEVYGGALLNSWLDRDLSLAGRVHLHDGSARLLRIDRPLCRVAQLAIHLDRDVNEKGVQLNRQQHLAPLLGLAGTEKAEALLSLAAEAVGVAEADVLGHELMLFDTLAPSYGGLRDEFLFSARLDNQAMCHAGLWALGAAKNADLSHVAVLALFDHEEVGSNSAEGAASAYLPQVLERIAGSRERFFQMLARSSCVSADMAHAVHPNYADRHDARHKVRLNQGPVIKVNAQQRYATNAETAAWFAAACREVDVPVQYYAHRTDLPCGSTIGPITATSLGIPTVDVGNPMLSMHSARELGGTADPALMTRALQRYFER